MEEITKCILQKTECIFLFISKNLIPQNDKTEYTEEYENNSNNNFSYPPGAKNFR